MRYYFFSFLLFSFLPKDDATQEISLSQCMHSLSIVSDIDARPWDFQAEECALRAGVEQFNRRRYESASRALEFSAVDTCAQSVLGHTSDLPEEFNVTYERWLEREVFSDPIRWEELLQQ